MHCTSFDVWVWDMDLFSRLDLTRWVYARSWGYRILDRHVSNAEVRGTTGCSPLSHLVTNRGLRLFGHTARRSSRGDHHRALAAAIRQEPDNWKRPIGRPSHILLRAIEADLGSLNIGLATAWRKATTGDKWQHIVDTATPQWSTLWKKIKTSCTQVMTGLWRLEGSGVPWGHQQVTPAHVCLALIN